MATEGTKPSNVNIMLMVESGQKCAFLVGKLRSLDRDQFRQSCLESLSQSLSHYQDVLLDKIRQLERENHNVSTEKHTAESQDAKATPLTSSPPDDASNARKLAIEDTIIPRGHVVLGQVAGLQEAKQTLREAIIMPLQFPHLFTGNRKPWQRILLYGPPGTGKSRLAQALASEINSVFYCVSSSDLISSYVGESEKLIRELFHQAGNQDGRSVIFIDEIDSICRQRLSKEEEHTRRIKTELLKQMEGADSSSQTKGFFLLCATNCPWDLDTAFLRRFQRRIYIPLPGRDARIELINIHTKDSPVSLKSEDLDVLADRTEGFSGSDIANMVLAALFVPIREITTAQYWRNTNEGKMEPCEMAYPKSFPAKLIDLPAEKVQAREVTIEDFLKSLDIARKTISTKEVDNFASFTNAF